MHRLLLLLLCLLIGGGCEPTVAPSAAPATATLPEGGPPLPQAFVRGVTHAHVHRRGHGYGSAASAQELTHLRELGVNWVALVPFAYQDGADADGLRGFAGGPRTQRASERSRDGALTEEHLVEEIAAAHARGMQVMLKPHIWSRDFWGGTHEWHGSIRQDSAAAHANWWADYCAYVLHYARLAERCGVEAYCIGTELVRMTGEHPQEWRALIGEVRQVYRGQVTYAAHWESEFSQIPFWDALDAIGITAYFPLAAPAGATVDELVAAWRPHLERIAEVQARFDKPVVFLEAGYRPVADTHREPWLFAGGEPDSEAQARAYEAMFIALADAAWWRGVFLWKTFTDPAVARQREQEGFSFRYQPAEEVVRQWFAQAGG